MANTNSWLKSIGVKAIKIRVSNDDDLVGPVGLKLEVRDKSKEGASSSGTKIKLKVSHAMEKPSEKTTLKGKEIRETQIQIIELHGWEVSAPHTT